MVDNNRAAFGPIGRDAASLWELWVEEEARFWLEENPNSWFPKSYSMDSNFKFGIDPQKIAEKNGWSFSDWLILLAFYIPINETLKWNDKGLTRKN
mgnify:FL=1